MAARPRWVMRSARGAVVGPRRQTGSEPLAQTSSIRPSVRSLRTSFCAAPPFRLGASSMPLSSRCEAADSSTRWVSVSFIGILLRSVTAPAPSPPKPRTGENAGGAGSRNSLRGPVQELERSGWTVGQNIVIETRFASGQVDQMREHAAELASLPAEVILASGTLQMKILQHLTSTIPVVFAQASDPVGDGFVESIARPGINATGFPNVEATMSAKWLELLKEIAPSALRVGLVFHPEASPRG